MEAAAILSCDIGIKPACEALEVSRAGFYRTQTASIPLELKKRPSPPRALSLAERREVLNILHADRFVDKAPQEVYATFWTKDNPIAPFVPCTASSTTTRRLRSAGIS